MTFFHKSVLPNNSWNENKQKYNKIIVKLESTLPFFFFYCIVFTSERYFSQNYRVFVENDKRNI